MALPPSHTAIMHSPIQLTQEMFANPHSPLRVIYMKSTQYENEACIYKHSHYKINKEFHSHSNSAIAQLQAMVPPPVT